MAGAQGVAPRPPDALQRLLSELRFKTASIKDGAAAAALRKHVQEEARDLSAEGLTKFLDILYDRINCLIESADVSDNLGALRAIDVLIDVELGESATKTMKFANCVKRVLEEKQDPDVLVLASEVLGHIVSTGPQTADIVESQVSCALKWLRGESRRFAAVLILKEMADQAPTVFNVHVPEFVDAIWIALRDPRQAIREHAVEALRACLTVIVTRETRWRVRWYYRMFEATQDGLGKNATVESIHGSLLAVGELLRNTGEFMMSRYKEVLDIAFKFRDHRDRLVRRSITSLLPRIAHFLRDRFVTSYFNTSMDHLVAVMRNPSERSTGFAALGEMAGAVGCALGEYLPAIMNFIRDALQPRRGKPSMEAIACVGNLTEALGPLMEEHVRSTLDIMFDTGLTPTLEKALNQIVTSLPSLLPPIQERLLDFISLVLCKAPYFSQRKSLLVRLPQKAVGLPSSEIQGPALVQLALKILTNFNFKGHDLLEFAREAVVMHLEDDDAGVRRHAARCCCRLVEHSYQTAITGRSASRLTSGRPLTFRKHRILIEEILEKLLVAAVSDTDASVREDVFVSLGTNGSFYDFLAQADCLKAIFIAFNDQSFEVRKLSIVMAGKLSDKNAAYVCPALRRHLQQLLTDMEHSADSKSKEESAILLGSLIRACETLITPYVIPIHKALVARLSEGSGGSGNIGVVSGVMATVGELARVAGCAIRPHIKDLMPLIVDALRDTSAASKRDVAVRTLGQLVQNTGYVVTPYTEFPHLLGLLLRILLNGELEWSTRNEVLKVLGVIGALDPHVNKRNELRLHPSDGNRSSLSETVHGQTNDESLMEAWPTGGISAATEDYYSTVAINALMRTLRDPSSSIYHQSVVKSLMYICKVMGLGCVPYLPQVMPDLLLTIRNCEDNLREFIFCQLADLVAIVRQHIRKYLSSILSLVLDMILPTSPRSAPHSPILHLVERLCVALHDEFRIHMPEILPKCIQALNEAERNADYAYVASLLHTFEVFGASLDEHMHLVLPALVRLFKPDVSNAPMDIRRSTIKTFSRLLPCMQVTAHVSSLLHPLLSVLDGTKDELRNDAVDAICVLATVLGAEFTMFLPSVRKLLQRHHLQHPQFDSIESRLKRRDPILVDVRPTAVSEADIAASSHGPELDGENALSTRGTQVNEVHLRSAWESSQRSTKEDWSEWMRHFSLELLKESPSPALRTCAPLAQRQPHVARELFAVAFVSCWSQLNDSYKKQLVRSLNYALTSPNIPSDILGTLLNLAEFMERDEDPLPVDTRTLGSLAEKCHLFAKALHYKEMEFDMVLAREQKHQLVGAVEALIHVNNQLHQHEAAVGILTYAQRNLGVQLKESWYEKLQRWEAALDAYTAKASQATSPHASLEPTLGRMRCLVALARWEELSTLCRETWSEPSAQLQMAPMAASAAWNMGEWEEMEEYVSQMDNGDEMNVPTRGQDGTGTGFAGAFFRAVLCIRRSKYDEAGIYAERARKCLATELAALVLESYDRAYSNMVRVQQLAELEEVIEYCTLQTGNPASEARASLIRRMWRDRIQGAKRNVEVWQRLLSVRTLVLPPTEDAETWLKFASLCYKSGRVSQSHATLIKLLQYDPEQSDPPPGYVVNPPVMLAYLKYLWSFGEESKRQTAYRRLQYLALDLANGQASMYCTPQGASGSSGVSPVPLIARIYLKLGTWNWSLHPSLPSRPPAQAGVLTTGLNDESIREISSAYKSAIDYARAWGKAWHRWALFNTAALSHYSLKGDSVKAAHHVVSAVSGYFKSIANASTNKGGDDSLQDILRLLTLWFNHGASDEVYAALQDGFKHVIIDTWLVVLPQIIARIHSHIPAVRELIQQLLVRIGQIHPQALMYPLLVACKSISSSRKTAALTVVDRVRQHHVALVEQAQLVSQELIRVAILWHEMWYEALEEASRLYFGEHNKEGMLNVLEPLHRKLEEEGAVTLKEIAFVQAYGRELQEAHEWCMEYRRTGNEAELTQAWDLYYHVFKRINKQLPSVTTLELQYVSPALLNARNLELAVPGTYRPGPEANVVTIQSFDPQLIVMPSKQRPRKCTIKGSDGQDYTFLLKGHEDLRQDERVMQLFGLVNTLLTNARHTAEKDLSIQRYDVVPLSPNSGLIGWVPNCDTLHHLIREYRDARKVPVNAEHRAMVSFAPDLDHLTLIAKVEVFQHALEATDGDDLAKVFWLKSKTSEVWLERRTNYTRSLAVMSMVGYLLGLGDRHPSNLMLNRYSGKILHIDFGDCFEAAMTREKFPEKVPFRLTRMLVKAMEVSGIEGNFRSICEDVMHVLRSNKDSVMAMMEAFVHDPLINWRLFNINDVPASMANIRAQTATQNLEAVGLPSPPQRGAREREMLHAFNVVGQLGDANE
ncbi:serine/threonine-protein kinase TOR, partial [Selaginella moellendorffii]|uniref:serine/threonine-protein kinase TOR n=1 Tax=Selaginella moellendorffii TaxID=88036 RepID=UPI000D1CC064